MKIRFTPYFMALFVLLFGLNGCAKYTDFVPKGQNLLNRADDLDQLMNVNYSGSAFNFNRLSLIVNDMYLLAYTLYLLHTPSSLSSFVVQYTQGKSPTKQQMLHHQRLSQELNCDSTYMSVTLCQIWSLCGCRSMHRPM